MRKPHLPRHRLTLPVLLVVAALCGTAGGTYAAFSSSAVSGGNALSAASDFVAPTASPVTIAKQTGYSPGYVKQGGSYRIYANVSDSGNPASGVGTVTGNVSTLTSGSSAVPLTAASYSVGGLSYTYRSAVVVANPTLLAGSFAFTLTSADLFSTPNTRTQTGFSVTVDNTAPVASDIQTANLTSTAGKAQQGDTITYTYSEPVDPESILSGWNGTSTNVVVRISTPDPSSLTVFNATNTTQLRLGTVNLGGSYVASSRTFGVTGTASTMAMSGFTITVTLGNPSGATKNVNTGTSMVWTPAATAYDRAGNAASTVASVEPGAVDPEF